MKAGRAEIAGRQMAFALIEFINLMYQKNTARRVIRALVYTLKTSPFYIGEKQ